METITSAATNAATAASKAIWGEQTATQQNETGGKEPISGETGKGTPNEPYDQGNSDNATSPETTNTLTSQSNDTNTPNTDSKDTPDVFKNTNTFTTVDKDTPSHSYDKDTPSHSNDKNPFPADSKDTPSTTMSSHTPINPNSAATGGGVDPLRTTEKTGVIGDHTGDAPKTDTFSPTERSSNPGAAPASGAAPFAKHQGADMPTEEPSHEQVGAISSKTDDAEEIMKRRDPNDHSGEPMHMHGGDDDHGWKDRRTSIVGNPGGQEHGKEPKGTGEIHVKSSGLAAHGGDFDATKPGAGKEAYRLLEESGIKKDTTTSAAEPSTTTSTTQHDTSPGGDKEKEKLGDKIKNKLHIGHKNK